MTFESLLVFGSSKYYHKTSHNFNIFG